MEYIIIGGIALAVFIFLFTIIKVEKLRNRANALFLEAEKYITQDKFKYVCDNLYKYIPNILKLFLNEDFFKEIIQMIYNNTREVARDLLDNGKLDKSNKEEK
jgi:hypothetical protein